MGSQQLIVIDALDNSGIEYVNIGGIRFSSSDFPKLIATIPRR